MKFSLISVLQKTLNKLRKDKMYIYTCYFKFTDYIYTTNHTHNFKVYIYSYTLLDICVRIIQYLAHHYTVYIHTTFRINIAIYYQ